MRASSSGCGGTWRRLRRDEPPVRGVMDAGHRVWPRRRPGRRGFAPATWCKAAGCGAEDAAYPAKEAFGWLLDNQLVDEITPFRCPVVVGQGTRLFADAART
jgi:hypothetical protein